MTAAHHLEVELYFDILSPYSLFAIETFRHYAVNKKWNVKLDLKPASVYVIRSTTGEQTPERVAARAAWMLKEYSRGSVHFGVPTVQQPQKFPIDSALPLKVLALIREKAPAECLLGSARALLLAYWTKDLDISREDVISKVLQTEGHKEANIKKLIEAAKTSHAQLLLEHLTKEAVDRGAFSLPTFTARRLDLKTGKPMAEKQEPLEDSGGISEKAGKVIGEWELFYGHRSFPTFAEVYRLPWHGPNPEGAKSTNETVNYNPAPTAKY